MQTKRTNQLLAAVLSIVMILSLVVVPVGAAVPMGGEPVAEVPAEDAQGASLSSVQRPAAAELLDATGKTDVDVWDFGAEQLTDTDAYHFVNHLTVDIINSWYPDTVEAGTPKNNFPSTGMPDVDGLSYTTAGASNHRLRTKNTALTRNDDKDMNGDGNDPYVPNTVVKDDAGNVTSSTPEVYNGYIYSNSSKNKNVYFQIALQAGDIVTAIISSNGTDSLINFEGPSGVEATCLQNLGSSSKGMTMTFYARETGNYKIYSSTEKLTMGRLYREHAKEVTVSGEITEAPGMPSAYQVLFTNTKTGSETALDVTNGAYTGTLLAPYSYDVSLQGAEGFAVLEGTSLTLDGAATATHDMAIQAISRAGVTGAITGLSTEDLAKLELVFTPTGDGVVYLPTAEIDPAGEYYVRVEKNMPHTISAKWVNDYEITVPETLTGKTWTAAGTMDLTFAKKPVHKVTIQPTGVALADLATATFTFTKLDEAGVNEDETIVPFNPKSANNLDGAEYHYVYTFTGTDAIELRDDTYNVAVETDAGTQNVTSNLVVNGEAVTKPISFTPAPTTARTEWIFNGTGSVAADAPMIQGTTGTWLGLEIDATTGKFASNGANWVQFNTGAVIKVPVDVAANGEKVKVTIMTYGNGEANASGTLKVGETPNATKGADEVIEATVEDGYITITALKNDYLGHIKIEPAVKVYPTEWDFLTGSGASGQAYPEKTLNGITVTGNGSNFKTHGETSGYGAAAKNTTLTIPVKGACKVTLNVGNSYDVQFDSNPKLEVKTGGVAKNTLLDYNYTGEEGTVTVTCGGDATTYIKSITVTYPKPVYYGTEWDFRNDGVGQGTSYYATGETSKTFADKNGVGELVVSGGVFGGHNATYGTEGKSYTMTVPVMDACTVQVGVGYQWYVWADGTNVTSSFTEAAPATKGNMNAVDNVAGQGDLATVSFKYTGTEPGEVVIHTTGTGSSYISTIKVVYDNPDLVLPQPPVLEDIVLHVDKDNTAADGVTEFTTITDALEAAATVKREATQRITIEIEPGDYEEQLYIKVKNLTLKNASATPSIALKDKGVGIDDNAVRITWYYGHGYTYYSMTKGHRYDADVLAANKANGYPSYINAGSGSTDDSYWNASVLVAADGFQAEGIIFENSFNQYVSAKSVEDVIVPQSSAKEGGVSRADMKTVGDTTVQQKEYVERAGAVSIKSGTNIWFDNCAFVGRQDVLYGPEGSTVALYGCDIYGGTDYIYGGMTMVAAKCNLILNTSENNNDVAYITAPQQKTARGYLLYNCNIKSTEPGVNTASTLVSKPCYFGRPWLGTGEAVFLNTNIGHTDPSYIGVVIDKDAAGNAGKATASLIVPVGWNASLGGASEKSMEYGTVECCEGVDNSASRISWSKVLTADEAKDYTVAAFLGDWDPFTANEKDMTVVAQEKHTAIEAATLPTKVEIDALVAPADTTLAVGETLDLNATVTPPEATQTVTWSSSDVNVATVDETGKVTAVAGGVVTITARTANGMLSDTLQLTVNVPVAGVTLDKTAVTMGQGRSTTLVATVEPANATDPSVTFESDTPAVATVDETGKVVGVSAGEATITVTTTDGSKAASCTVTISEPYTPVAVTGVTVADADDHDACSVNLGTEQIVRLHATVLPAEGSDQEVNWSSDTEGVTVSPSGKVTISADVVTPGKATITATTMGLSAENKPLTDTYEITLVKVDVTGVTVTGPEGAADAAEYTVGTEQTLNLTAVVAPPEATVKGVTWTSSDTTGKVAVVASTDDPMVGVVTVAADAVPGEYTITAASTDNAEKKDTYVITLKPVLVTGITITGPENNEFIIGTEQTVNLTATVAPANATEKGVTWSSDNEKVTVTDGVVKILADAPVGTATITATAVGKTEAGATVSDTYVLNLRVPYKPVETVTVTAPVTEVAQGGTVQLTAAVEPAEAEQDVTWSSGDESGKVTVNATGLVTVAADAPAGKVTITATSVAKDAADKAVTGTIEITVVTPADALKAAIEAAQAELDGTEISEDGTDVSKRDVWTTQGVRDTMQGALDTAKAKAEKEDATADELLQAIKDLNAAVAEFVAARKDGTKRNPGHVAIGTTTKPGTTKTETSTNDKGDVATTTINSDGDKTITVVNKDGETVAEINLPATIPASKTKFKDVPEGHWAEESIDHMAALGMVQGVNEAHDIFDMTASMTRASIATMFFRLSNGKEGATSTFADVAEGQWYTDAIGWAAKTGVVTGYSETEFGPNDTITRQQLAVMLQRYANLIGMDAKAHASALDPFVDGDEADDWAVNGLAWCVKNGIMKGRGDDVLDPTAEITRAEATAMFDRVITLFQK